MENQKNPRLDPEDALKAENVFLKMKLGLEHGMEMSEINTLSPDVENQWLKSVYAFEQHYKDAKRIRLYDYLGKPEFKKWDTLAPEDVNRERKRLESIMEENNVKLDCLCEYEDVLIYKFITEELFDREMDDMRIPGMTLHYTYEEFHPNHDYDLRHEAEYFINAIFMRLWDPEFDNFKLADKINFSGKEYSRMEMGAIICAFQEAHDTLDLESLDIISVVIGPELAYADVQANVHWSGRMDGASTLRYEGVCSFRFVRPQESWCIAAFDIPGLST